MIHRILSLLLALTLIACGDDGSSEPAVRVEEGLIAYYPMIAGGGGQILDRSDVTPRHTLQILASGPGVTDWLEGRNGVTVVSENIIIASAASKLQSRISASNAFTLEVWFTPADTSQSGAWITSYGQAETERNIALVQSGAGLEVWLRTTATDSSGLLGGQPPLAAPDVLSGAETHAVVTFDGATLTLYINGIAAASASPGGDLSTWSGAFDLVLANASSGNHMWLGEVYQLAWYERALSSEEVTQNHALGSLVEAEGVTP